MHEHHATKSDLKEVNGYLFNVQSTKWQWYCRVWHVLYTCHTYLHLKTPFITCTANRKQRVLIYDTFYVIVQILVSMTNHKCNVAAIKTVLMRFDGIENSIFFIISILFTKTSVTSKITHDLLLQPHDRMKAWNYVFKYKCSENNKYLQTSFRNISIK